MGEDELRCRLVELDVPDWVLQRGQLLARTAWLSVLADGRLSEFDLPSIRIAVDVDICDTHCCGWNVYIATLLFGSGGGMPNCVRSWYAWCCSSVRKLLAKLVMFCGGWFGDLFIQTVQRVDVSLRSQGQIVIGLLALFGVRETWRRHVYRGCWWFDRDRVMYLN